MSNTDPTSLQTLLQEVLSYDPETGVFTWRIDRTSKVLAGHVAGCLNKRGYRIIPFLSKYQYAHRLAWLYVYGKWPDGVIDHINGDTADNRLANLRDVAASTNLQNIKITGNNTGVRPHGKKWAASIFVDRRSKYLGLFSTKEMAKDAYTEAKKLYHPGFLSR